MPIIPDFGKLGQINKLRTRLSSMWSFEFYVSIHGSWSLALPGMSLTDFGGWALLLQNELRSIYSFLRFIPLAILSYEWVMCRLTLGNFFSLLFKILYVCGYIYHDLFVKPTGQICVFFYLLHGFWGSNLGHLTSSSLLFEVLPLNLEFNISAKLADQEVPRIHLSHTQC